MFGLGGSPDNDTSTEIRPWDSAKPYLRSNWAQVNQAGNQLQPYYPAETYAPFNALQQGGQYGMLDYAQNRYQPQVYQYQNALGGMINDSRTGGVNPYLERMLATNASRVGKPLIDEWLPQARSGAGMAGQYGGSRQGVAEGLAMDRASENLANANAETMFKAWQSGQENAIKASAFMPGALQMGFQGPQTAMNIGGMQQGMHQRGVDDLVTRYNYPEQATFNMLGQQSNIYQNASPYTSQSGSVPGSSGLANLAGGALTGFGLHAAGTAAGLGTAATATSPALLAGMGPGGWALGGAALLGLLG